MTDNHDGTRFIVEELRVALARGGKLAVALEFAGKVEEARQVSAKIGDLRAQLDRLLTGGGHGWSAAVSTAVAEFRAANRLLQGDIVDIKKRRDLPAAVTKALERLDAMIADAKGIAGGADSLRQTHG